MFICYSVLICSLSIFFELLPLPLNYSNLLISWDFPISLVLFVWFGSVNFKWSIHGFIYKCFTSLFASFLVYVLSTVHFEIRRNHILDILTILTNGTYGISFVRYSRYVFFFYLHYFFNFLGGPWAFKIFVYIFNQLSSTPSSSVIRFIFIASIGVLLYKHFVEWSCRFWTRIFVMYSIFRVFPLY